MKKKILFIDRDGTIINEAPPTYQIDSFEKLTFYPHVFEYLGKIARELDYVLMMVTNQDGLGRPSFPEDTFTPVHEFVIKTFEGEGIYFSEKFIDRTIVSENAETRKPGIGMLKHFLKDENYDIPNSFVIGDRITDVMLAKNLGCKSVWLHKPGESDIDKKDELVSSLRETIALESDHWKAVYEYLKVLK